MKLYIAAKARPNRLEMSLEGDEVIGLNRTGISFGTVSVIKQGKKSTAEPKDLKHIFHCANLSLSGLEKWPTLFKHHFTVVKRNILRTYRT